MTTQPWYSAKNNAQNSPYTNEWACLCSNKSSLTKKKKTVGRIWPMGLSLPMAETVLRSPRNRRAMLIPQACLRVSHSCIAHICLSLCVGMRSYVSVVWEVVRRERDRTHVCTESDKSSKMRWPWSVRTSALSQQCKGSSPRGTPGELYTVSEIPSASLSLLWASALWRKRPNWTLLCPEATKIHLPRLVYQTGWLSYRPWNGEVELDWYLVQPGMARKSSTPETKVGRERTC